VGEDWRGHHRGLSRPPSPDVSATHADPVPVLSLLGATESGSTLLDMLLGRAPGVFSAGELRSNWARGLLQGQPCSCGEQIRACPVWRPIVIRGFGSISRPAAADE